MRAIKQKLSGSRGETLVETLVAIMVAALSATLLATSMLTASKINRRAGEKDAAFEAQLQAAENFTGVFAEGSVVLIFEGGGSKTAGVSYYGGAGRLTSYRYAAEGSGG